MKERFTDGRQKTTMASCILLSYEIRIFGKQRYLEATDMCEALEELMAPIIDEKF